jgi:GAF domain-containing protein/ActR/RegA family two-component response regulator
VLITLAALWGVGGVILLRRLDDRQAARLAETTEAARAALDDAQAALLREARMLAQDPALAEGVAGADAVALARTASPRLVALTVERLADLLLLIDLTGSTLVQLPPVPRLSVPDLPVLPAPTGAVRVVGGRAYLLGLAPLRARGASDGPSIGMAVVGRRLDHLERSLARTPGQPAIVALADDRLVGSTRAELPATGWLRAQRGGAITMSGGPASLRSLDTARGLWAVLPTRALVDERRQLLVAVTASFALAAAVVLVVAWLAGVRPRVQRQMLTQTRELDALHAVVRTMASGSDVVTTAEQLLDIVCGVARMDGGALYRLDGRALTMVAQRGLGAAELARVRVRPVEGSHLGEVARTGRIVMTDLTRSPLMDRELREVAAAHGRRAQLALPVRVDGRTWGVVALLSSDRRRLGADEVKLLDAVAHQMGLAVVRASLIAEAGETGRRLETLARLGRTLTATLSFEEVLQRVVDAAVTIFASSQSQLWVVDEEGEGLSLQATSGSTEPAAGQQRLAAGEGLVGVVLATRQPLVVADLTADPRVRHGDRARAEGLVAFAAVPVTLGSRVLAVLTIAMRQAHDYRPEEIGLLESLAHHAAVAIDNARRFAEETTRRAQLAALLEINKKIGAAESADALLSAIAEEAARLLDVDNAGFRLVEGNELVLAGLAGTAAQTMLRSRIKIGESFSGRVVQEGRTLIAGLEEMSDLLPEHRAADERLGYNAFLGVPLRAGARIIGVLAFRARHPFDHRALELAEAFADQAAIALEHARLYREASRQAERMTALADVERLLSETLDPDLVARRVADSVRALLGAQSSAVYRLVAESGDLVAIAAAGEVGPSFATIVFPRGTGVSGLAVRERRPVVVSDLLSDARVELPPDLRARIEQAPYRAVLCVPLVVHDRVIGALGIGDRAGRAFDEGEIRLAQTFADQAALALENARLHGETERRREQAEELARLARTLTETLDVGTVCQRIIENVPALFGVHSASIRLVRPDGGLEPVGIGGSWRGSLAAAVLPRGTGVGGAAVLEGRPVWSADVLNDPRFVLSEDVRRGVEETGNRAFLAVPLRVTSKVIGVLTIADATVRSFSSAEIELLQAIGDQAALAMENARLHEEAEQRRREAEVLAELARTINASLDLGTVLQRVAEGARELTGSDMARIALRDVDSERVRFRHWVGARFQGYDTFVLEPGRGVSGVVMSTGRPFRTDDYLNDPRIDQGYAGVVHEEGIVAELSVPIRTGDRSEGVLNVNNRVARPFTDRHEAILLRLADQAAIAIQNARLYETVEVRAARLRTLTNVNRLVSSSLDTDEVLRAMARAASELIAGAVVGFWVADESSRTVRISVFSDDRVGADFPIDALSFGEAAIGWVAAHRRPLEIPDIGRDGRDIAREWARAHGLTGMVALPIVLQSSLLGVLALYSRTPVSFGRDEQSLLESFAAQAAIALEHARLYAQTARRLEETRALLEVAEILNATLDSRQLLKRVTIKIAQVCRVDRCSLELWDGDRVTPLMAQFADGHHDPAMWNAFMRLPPYPPRLVPAQARALDTRRPVIIDDATRTDQLPRDWVETYQHKSYLAVPLLRQDQVMGVLTLDYVERVTPFQSWQVQLATAIAGQVALALENSRLYTEAQERLRETTTLLAVGRVLSEPGPIQEMMRRVAREVGRAFGADMVGAYVLDEQRRALWPMAGWRVPEQLREWFRGHPMAVDAPHELFTEWRAGRVVASGDTSRDPRFDPEWVGALPPHSVLVAPTRLRGESVGGFFVVWWQIDREFRPSEVRLIEGVAAQVGLALENAALARQRELRLKETETLLAVSRSLSSTLDLDTLLRHFMRQITRATGADAIGVCMLDADGQWLTPTAGYRVPPAWMPIVRDLRLSVVEHPFYAEAARTRRAVFARDVATDARLPAFVVEQIPHRSQLFVPILIKGRLVGGFVAAWLREPRDFTPGELALMEAIGNQAGAALDNARLFEQNRRQVEELTVLHELSRAVTGQLDEQALLAALHRLLPRVLPVDKFVVLLVGEPGDEVEVVLRVRHGQIDREGIRRYPSSTGLASVVLQTGRPLRVDDYRVECEQRSVALPETDGPPRWMGVPLLAGDAVLGVLTVSRDQQPFTEAEQRLAASIADLAALALRSARLFEERSRAYGELAAAQDHLVRTEKLRALGEMASGVAHDFNNLLAAILGRTQLLLRFIEESKFRQWLQVIERSAMDGAQTVRRLQEFARVRRDQPLVPVDLNQVVHDALEITQSRWREEALRRGVNVAVQTRLTPLSPVAGDPAELREAMTNLILNAVDAMPEGGTLTLTTAALMDGEVELAVSDTGVGMSEAVRQKIFDPFFTTKGPQGTGLGLAMTYGIVSRHGARITVDSQEGRGSTFRIVFPTTDAPAASRADALLALPASTGVFRCLVVDDEEAVGSVIGDILESIGHKVVVARSGAEAIERFRAEAFDAVFTDLAMPGVSGWQVAHAVKELAPGVAVFLVTGFGVELSADEKRAHGVDGVFAKPLRIDDIVAAMTQVARTRPKTNGSEEP